MSVTGERDDEPGGGPQKVGVPIVDIMTGMYAAVAVLAALARRDETGQGRVHRHRDARRSGRVPRQPGDELPRLRQAAGAQRQRASEHPAAGRVRVRATATSCWRSATTTSSRNSVKCSRVELAEDERFATNAPRVRNNAALTPILVEALAAQDRDFWVEGCARAGVPCGPINTIPEALADSQVTHREMRMRSLTTSRMPRSRRHAGGADRARHAGGAWANSRW